ncbi:MAG: DUF4124 domain-containing protein [Halofilum sp. (in: g-proteobacteria)]
MRAGYAITILLLFPALTAGEEIYRSTDDQGNPLFTDQAPSDSADPVTLEPLTTVAPDEAPPQFQAPAEEESDESEQVGGYSGIEVAYPPAGQAVRHNGGMVPFRVALQPDGKSLDQGHRIEILLDGDVRGAGANEQISVSPVDRGTHTVVARVVDASGTPLVASSPIDFHLLRASLGNN